MARQYEAGLIVIETKGKQGAGPIVVGAVAGSVLTLIGNYAVAEQLVELGYTLNNFE